jgi:hypothetical protein
VRHATFSLARRGPSTHEAPRVHHAHRRRERLKIIEDQEIEAIEAIDGGLEFELAACNLELLNKVGRPGVLVKVDHPCAQMDASGGVE